MDEPLLMNLYTSTFYNLRMCMKENNPRVGVTFVFDSQL